MNTLSTFYNNSKTLIVDNTDANTDADEPDLNHSSFKFLIFSLNKILLINFRRAKGL